MVPTARAVFAALLLSMVGACKPWAPPAPVHVKLLQANVGNALLSCEPYVFKLCKVDVEDRIRESIAQLKPDIIAFQEVLPHDFCEGFDDDDPTRICGGGRTGPQIERLLPDGYTYLCDPRNGYECVAARAPIELGDRYTTADRVPSDDRETCDDGFTVGSVGVFVDEVNEGDGDAPSLTLVNGHPQSGFIGACRAKQLEQAFQLSPDSAILSGDMNVDPFADNPDDPSVAMWNGYVGRKGRRFHYLSGPAEHEPPFFTIEVAIVKATMDHVVSDTAHGTCKTLGVHDGTDFLDGDGIGTDHRALLCDAELERDREPLPH